MSFIEKAVLMWTDTLNTVFRIIFMSPEEWNNNVWNLIELINDSMIVIGSSLLALFFSLGLLKSGLTLTDFKRPAVFIKPFVRLGVSYSLLLVSMKLMVNIFAVVQGMMAKIVSRGNASFKIAVPKEVAEALNNGFDFSDIMVGIIGLILTLVIFFMGIYLSVIVWSRFIKIYIYCAISPLFIAGAGGEPTQNIATNFIKSFCNAALQGVIVVLALMIYSALISSDSSDAVAAINAGDDFTGILLYTKDFLIAGLVVLGICKSSEQIINKFGL